MIPPLKRFFPIGDAHDMTFGQRRFLVTRIAETVWKFQVFNLEKGGDPSTTWWEGAPPEGNLYTQILGPDRPLLVKFSEERTLSPKGMLTIGMYAPLTIQFSLTAERKNALWDGPVRQLSKTWAGSVTEGEPAWEWRTEPFISAAPSPEENSSDLAICQLTMKNLRAEPLVFSRMAIRLAHSPIFVKDKQLWTGQLEVDYHGGGRAADLRYSENPPAAAGRARFLCRPRTPRTSSLIAWTLQNLSSPTSVIGL